METCLVLWVVAMLMGTAIGVLLMFALAIFSGIISNIEAAREEDKFHLGE
jgi:hypothetical protein